MKDKQQMKMNSQINLMSRLRVAVLLLTVAATQLADVVTASNSKSNMNLRKSIPNTRQPSQAAESELSTQQTTNSAAEQGATTNNNEDPRRDLASQWFRFTSNGSWPHHLTLVLQFDVHPDQVSWKFENARSQKILAGAAFGDYIPALYARQTLEVPLDILTEDDYDEDGEEVFGGRRDYRFVIYDRGGNGLCCEGGFGQYELYSKSTLIAKGNEYGAIDEHYFSIDANAYLGANNNNNQNNNGNGNNNNQGSSGGGVSIPSPTVGNAPTPLVVFNTQPVENNAEQVVATLNTPTQQQAAMPSLMSSFFCGASFTDAETNCHLPCPTGSPSVCATAGLEGHRCFASTTCRERMPTPAPTTEPTEEPTDEPSRKPTPPPTLQPTVPRPTVKPTPQPIPTAQLAIDATTWFCGDSWDWIENNCDKATPCPGGDAIDCPANQECFASTPCTLSPSMGPSMEPSNYPTKKPTPEPTKAPWSEESFLDFLNGQSNNQGGSSNNNNNNNGGSSGVNNNNNNNEGELAAKVNEALENYSSLQYHFFCGISWTHADETCKTFCPLGDKKDCPDGEECYANTQCDGRDTASPTTSPAPSSEGVGEIVATGEICTICDGSTLDFTATVPFQTQQITCGRLNEMVSEEGILVGSNTCDSVRDMYRESCCFNECQLCQTPNGKFMDLKKDYVVQQGGYEASCDEVNTILSSAPKDDDLCLNAQTQLSDECCYEQCSLCGGMDTEWYATVSFQGLSTTCLGLDFMLRAQQISTGDARCSQIKQEYVEDCCVSPQDKNMCQLCLGSNDKLYDVDPTKTVSIQKTTRQITTTTCMAINDNMGNINKNNKACMEGKQAFFGQCCVLDLDTEDDNTGSVTPGVGGGESPNAPSGATAPQPSPGNQAPTNGVSLDGGTPTQQNPVDSQGSPNGMNPGGRPNMSPGGNQPQPSPTGGSGSNISGGQPNALPGGNQSQPSPNGGPGSNIGVGRPNAFPAGGEPQPTPVGGDLYTAITSNVTGSLSPTASPAPSSKSKPVTTKPAQPNYWPSPTDGNFEWEQDWNPPAPSAAESIAAVSSCVLATLSLGLLLL